MGRRRPDPRGGTGDRDRRGADGGLAGSRGARSHAGHGAEPLLVPLPPCALAQGRNLGACHTGARSCFFTRLGAPAGAVSAGSAGPAMLEVLERVLQSRKVAPPPGSYVASLFEKGEAQICRKIGEEATEGVTAALGG